MYGGVVGQSV